MKESVKLLLAFFREERKSAMKRLLATLVLGLLVSSAAFVEAAPYTYVMGPGSSVDTSGTSSVLEMQAIVNPNLNNLTFSLDVGQFYSFPFARIGTNESLLQKSKKRIEEIFSAGNWRGSGAYFRSPFLERHC